jgi:tetratricopeptide (TPR) repeat protein
MKQAFLILIAGLLLNSLSHAQISEKNKKESLKAYNEAVKYINQMNYELAMNYLEASLSYNENFYDALMLRGKTKVELNKIDGALLDFKQASLLEPSLGEPDFYLGYLNFKADTNAYVLEHLDKAINKGFKEHQVYYNRGLYKLVTGDFSGAIDDYTDAIDLKKDYALAYHDRGTAKRELGDMQGALYDYRIATNYEHNFPIAFNNMGSVKIILGDYNGALEDYSVAINLDSTFFIAYNNRGSAEYFLGDLDAALKDFESALAISEKYSLAMNNKAAVLAKNMENETAIAIFDEVINNSPNFAKAYLNRGLVKELLGDLEGACSDWNMALELGIEDAAKYVKECK